MLVNSVYEHVFGYVCKLVNLSDLWGVCSMLLYFDILDCDCDIYSTWLFTN